MDYDKRQIAIHVSPEVLIVAGQPPLTQSLNVIQLRKITVERPYRQMPGLSRDLEHQTIRKLYRRPRTILTQRRSDRLAVLQRQVLVTKQHVDSGCDPRTRELVNRIENPKGLRKYQVGYPGTAFDEPFGRIDLLDIVSHDESNENVRVNREHIAREYAF